MIDEKTYISCGDFIDLFYKVKQKGYNELLLRLHLSNRARTLSKWNTISSSSDFWIIPEIHYRWNEKCTGDHDTEYEDYLYSKFLSGLKGLRMLSVGCGTGSHERKFGKYSNFDLIEGIDMASRQIEEARKYASDLNLNNIKYIVGDFITHEFEPDSYDVVLFNSSLHHFKDIQTQLQKKVFTLLKKNGYLVIFEYVGPNRFQWTKQQLEYANELLTGLPLKFKIRNKSKSVKRRIYRPGLLRMLLVDPSEAINSESILPSIHKYFEIIEEKKIGWDILHPLLKDIAHNFLDNDIVTKKLLSYLFEKEDEYLSMTGRSDVIFGIYQKYKKRTW